MNIKGGRMPSEIRQPTENELEKATKIAPKIKGSIPYDLIYRAEREGFRTINYGENKNRVGILMPSGKLLIKDLKETGHQLDSLNLQSPDGDNTPNGELANAICYSGPISEYLRQIRTS
jgi:hypothetical protein